LADRRAWDKEIVVWLGSMASLLSVLNTGSADIEQLDLLELVSEEDIPEEEARAFFRRGLDGRLKNIAPAPGKRRILVVTATALLADFNTGLAGFFNWFCSDRGMVILQVDGVAEKLALPPEFEFRPNQLIDYLTQPDHAKDIYA
jgi:hypothetical protein